MTGAKQSTDGRRAGASPAPAPALQIHEPQIALQRVRRRLEEVEDGRPVVADRLRASVRVHQTRIFLSAGNYLPNGPRRVVGSRE